MATASSQIIKVYLQAGQSNSDGRAATNGLPANLLQPQSDVAYYYYFLNGPVNSDGSPGTLTTLRPGGSKGTGVTGPAFGPELTFGRTLADFFALTNHTPTNNVMVAIIKYARGGTALSTNSFNPYWSAGGDGSTNGDGSEYITFQQVVAAGLSRLAAAHLGATLELDGIIWVQGETDIDLSSGQTGLAPNPTVAAAYGTNLTHFINDVRLTYSTNRPYGANLPFFLSRISTNQTAFSKPTNPAYPYYLQVRAGQSSLAATMSNVFMIDTDGSQFSVSAIGAESSYGNQHYDTGGQQTLGGAFAQTLISALPKPQLQALAQSADGWRVTFTGVSGLNYVLERAANLLGAWHDLTNIDLGPSAITNFDDQTSLGSQAFYRVQFN